MHQHGQRQQTIAAALGLTQGAVSQIIARAEAGGVTALQYHQPQGAKARLTAAQKTDLLGKLRQGATAYGFQGDVWTCAGIAQVIAKAFSVTYPPDYIGPLLRQLGWSVPRPIVRATQRDETAIAAWAATDVPALKKSPKGGAYAPLYRRVSVLPAARCGNHLGADR